MDWHDTYCRKMYVGWTGQIISHIFHRLCCFSSDNVLVGDRVLNKNQYNTTLTKNQDKLYVSPSRLGSLSSQKYGVITYVNIYWWHTKGLTEQGEGVLKLLRIVTSWQLILDEVSAIWAALHGPKICILSVNWKKKNIFCLGLVYLIATQGRKLPTNFSLFCFAWWKQKAEVRKVCKLTYTCKARWKSKFLPHTYLHHDIIW